MCIRDSNKGVGKIIAQEVMKVKPDGNYAIILGDPGDPNAAFLREGMEEVIGDAVKAGTIKIVGEANSDGWKPENAQKNMEQILTANNNAVDAVLSENDGMAGGVVAALSAQGLAVSYTHLDVYKRQPQAWISMGGRARPVLMARLSISARVSAA